MRGGLEPEADIIPAAEPPGPRERLGGYELLRRVPALSDIEVWRAEAPDGSLARLKRVSGRAPAGVRAALRQEADVLQMLEVSGMPATPRVLEAELDVAAPWLALSWCEGVDLLTWARDPRRALKRRAGVAERLAGLYVELHERGVLHGEVAPHNALVDEADRVWLVDFGAARLVDAPPALAREQEAVAAIAYRVITGDGPPSGLASGEVATPPRSFAERGLAWPALERVLDKALAADPAARWPNLAAFARALSHTVAAGPPA